MRTISFDFFPFILNHCCYYTTASSTDAIPTTTAIATATATNIGESLFFF